MANGLIGKVTAGGGTHLIASTAYFTCETAAATAAKIAKAADTGLNSLTVITGMTIYVKFTNYNSAANPTLTLQTNGGTQLLAAKSIMRYGSTAPSTNAASSWKAGAVVALVYDGTNWIEVSSLDDDTTYGAEKGISLSSGKFGHSNAAITAQNTQALYPIKIDAYGHITGYGTAVTSLPASDVSSWAKASTKPTYTASEVGAATANHTHTTSLASDTGTTGVVSLTSGGTFKLTAGGTSVLFKMPEANSDTQVTQRLYSSNYNLPLLMSFTANTVTTTDSTNISYRNNNVYANPSTGLLNSTKFQVDKKVILEYNSTTESLDFIFN